MKCSGEPLKNPLRGVWPYQGFPKVVSLSGGRFVRAKWKRKSRGVNAQYREAVERHAMHLKVLKNGTYVIDHRDSYNPDQGHPVAHFFTDTEEGCALKQLGKVAAVCVVVVGVGVLALRGMKG